MPMRCMTLPTTIHDIRLAYRQTYDEVCIMRIVPTLVWMLEAEGIEALDPA